MNVKVNLCENASGVLVSMKYALDSPRMHLIRRGEVKGTDKGKVTEIVRGLKQEKTKKKREKIRKSSFENFLGKEEKKQAKPIKAGLISFHFIIYQPSPMPST